MCDIKDINCLFELWKYLQKNETNFENNSIFKASEEDIKSMFTIDGRFDSNIKNGGVLFICKESNISSDIINRDFGTKPFWLKGVIEAKENNQYYNINESTENASTCKRIQTKFYNCLSLILKQLNEKYNECYELKKCSFMNINKRGGLKSADNNKIVNYFNEYQEFILKEIELINPDIIVILSYCKEAEIILNSIKKNNSKCKFYTYTDHPSRYKKATEITSA